MVPYFPFLEAAYMAKMCGGSGVIQPLTVTQNGQYNAPEGVGGFNPVTVNVPKNIRSITITRNGTYTAPAGVDGYNPVIVNNPYEILWKQEHGQTEEIDTGLTDEEDKPIIIDGLPVDDIDDVINTGFPGDVTFAALSDSGLIYVRLQYKETVITPNWETQYYISVTVTNAQTGQSVTHDPTITVRSSTQYPVVTLNTKNYIDYHLSVYTGGGLPTGSQVIIRPSEVGVAGPFKYYICKSGEAN